MAKIKPLKKSKYLKGFSNKEVATFGAIVEVLQVSAGDRVFEEEAEADALYILAKGAIALSTNLGGSGEADLVTLSNVGDSFGELALLGEGSRAVSARVVEDGQVLIISREAFDDFRDREPTIAAKFLHALAREVGQIARATAPHVKTLLLLKRQADDGA